MKLPRNGPAENKFPYNKPAYSQVVLDRHAARFMATRECIELRLKSLWADKIVIEAKTISAPTNHGLLKELCKVDDQITKGHQKCKTR